jgi:hypothetical protein
MVTRDSGQTFVNVLLFRMYLSNLLNALILALTYIALANPLLFAEWSWLRSAVEIDVNPVYQCRLDETADALFTLVFTNFVTNLLTVYLSPWLTYFVYRYLGMDYTKFEFDISASIVGLLNFVSLVLLCFPFSPLTIIFMPIYLAIAIYWESYSTMALYAKPKRYLICPSMVDAHGDWTDFSSLPP